MPEVPPRKAVRIERLASGDEARILAATELFDHAPTEAYTGHFLDESGHVLLVAYEGDEPAGFVSGVEVAHPDKPVEMFPTSSGCGRPRGVGGSGAPSSPRCATSRWSAAVPGCGCSRTPTTRQPYVRTARREPGRPRTR